jgi:hypothetical protein
VFYSTDDVSYIGDDLELQCQVQNAGSGVQYRVSWERDRGYMSSNVQSSGAKLTLLTNLNLKELKKTVKKSKTFYLVPVLLFAKSFEHFQVEIFALLS